MDKSGINGRVDLTQGTTFSFVQNDGARLKMAGYFDGFFITIPNGADWGSNSHLLVTIENTGSTQASVRFGIESGPSWSHWVEADVALTPRRPVTVAIPFTDPRKRYGLDASPSIVGGGPAQLTGYGTYLANDVRVFRLYSRDKVPVNVTVRDVRAAQFPMAVDKYVDTYGQQAQLTWPGKVTGDSQLVEIEQENGQYPYVADRFGGYSGNRKFEPRSRFYIAKDGARLTLVDPLGNPFFSTGVGEVGWMAYSQVDDRESIFDNLPDPNGPLKKHYMTWSYSDGRKVKTFNFYSANLERKYGADWKNLAYQSFGNRLRSWGFNTIGASSDSNFANLRKMPYLATLSINGPHAKLYFVNGANHDPFDPLFLTSVQNSLTGKMDNIKADEWAMGLVVDNELPWGSGNSTNMGRRYELVCNVLRAPATQPAKISFVQMLQTQLGYANINDLNSAWGTNFASYAQMLANTQFSMPDKPSAKMKSDFEFLGYKYALAYYSTVRSVLNSLGYKGLYLGSRFLSEDYTPEAVRAAKEATDAITINIYNATPDLRNSDLKNIGFPVLITETGFGSNDNGRFGLAHYNTVSEEDRVAAFNRYMDTARSWNNLIGVHLYRWEDFPASGRIGDNENYSMGLVSVTDQPYKVFTDAAKLSNIKWMMRSNVTP